MKISSLATLYRYEPRHGEKRWEVDGPSEHCDWAEDTGWAWMVDLMDLCGGLFAQTKA